jgi:hypothetical protein
MAASRRASGLLSNRPSFGRTLHPIEMFQRMDPVSPWRQKGL